MIQMTGDIRRRKKMIQMTGRCYQKEEEEEYARGDVIRRRKKMIEMTGEMLSEGGGR